MSKDISFRNDRLRELRRNLDMTQKEFSQKIGCTMASLSAYENGSKIPPTATLVSIAQNFDCSIDWFFGLKNESSYGATRQPIQTYSEYIKLLFSLQNSKLSTFINCSCSDPTKKLKGLSGIGFNDPVIKLFLESWRKTWELYNDGTIDDTIYKAWQEKILRDFHHNIIYCDSQWEDYISAYHSMSEWPGITEYDAVLSALSEATGFAPTEPPELN